MATERLTSAKIQLSPQEILRRQYSSIVIVPYSSNLFERGVKAGEAHLSLFSALATVAAAQLYKNGTFQNILLCGESTFGEGKKTTTDLMTQKLIQLGIVKDVIQPVDSRNLNNTAFQMEALAKKQEEDGTGPYLLVDWRFHDKRVQKHARAYGLQTDTVSVEDTLSYFYPHFNPEKYKQLLESFDKRERSIIIRLLSGDRGTALKWITRFRGGSITDVKVVKNQEGKNTLELENTTGKKKLRQPKSI